MTATITIKAGEKPVRVTYHDDAGNISGTVEVQPGKSEKLDVPEGMALATRELSPSILLVARKSYDGEGGARKLVSIDGDEVTYRIGDEELKMPLRDFARWAAIGAEANAAL